MIEPAKALRRVRRAVARGTDTPFRPEPYGEKKRGDGTTLPVPRWRAVRWRLHAQLVRKLEVAYRDLLAAHPDDAKDWSEEGFALFCLDLGIETWAKIEARRDDLVRLVKAATPADMAKMSVGARLGGSV